MVQELTCQQCLEALHSIRWGPTTPSSWRPAFPGRCRRICTTARPVARPAPQSLQLEKLLQGLRQDLPTPDLRAGVMLKLRQGQRAPVPRLAAPARTHSGAREMALAMVVLTLVLGIQGPEWLDQLDRSQELGRIVFGPDCLDLDDHLADPGIVDPFLGYSTLDGGLCGLPDPPVAG